MLIGATIALAAMVMIWSQNLFKSTTETTGRGIESEMICASEVQFSISSATGTSSPSTVTVINNGERYIKEFIARIYDDSDPQNIVIGTGADSELIAYGSKTYTITYTLNGATAIQIELIPVIELDDGSKKTCGQNTEKAILT